MIKIISIRTRGLRLSIRPQSAPTMAGIPVLAALILSPMLSGCGGDAAYQTAKVKGRLLCDGEPVEGGFITFTPAEDVAGRKEGNRGKPAAGRVQSDGTFVLMTYTEGDGALLGKHFITFERATGLTREDFDGLSPQEREELVKAAGPQPKPVPCSNLVSPRTVEVVKGQNEFELTLEPRKN